MTIRWWRRWREVRARIQCRNCRRMLYTRMWVLHTQERKLFATKAWQVEQIRRYLWAFRFPCECGRRVGSEDVVPWVDGWHPESEPVPMLIDEILVVNEDDTLRFGMHSQ
jgi:hypothetical protein